MNVVQNYLVSVMKADFSLYEIRIFCRIVAQANTVLRGMKASQLMGKAFSADGVNINMTIPVKDLVTDGSHDYDACVQAANALLEKRVRYWSTKAGQWIETDGSNEGRENGDTYRGTHLITSCEYVKGSGVIKISTTRWLMEFILNFVYGNFSMYDFEKCLTLPSAYAVRLYWLTCSLSRPVTYPYKMLREMLGVGNKYKQVGDFIKRCLETPRVILEANAMNGFDYHKEGEGQKCKFTLFPVKRQAAAGQQVQQVSIFVNPAVRQYLSTAAGFDLRELNHNQATLEQFSALPSCEDKLVQIVERARKKRAGKGYIINAMKSAVTEARGPVASPSQSGGQKLSAALDKFRAALPKTSRPTLS